jgi:hypothetical protein
MSLEQAQKMTQEIVGLIAGGRYDLAVRACIPNGTNIPILMVKP